MALALVATAAAAQSAGDGRALLESVAAALLAAGNLHVEGVRAQESPHRETRFELAAQEPQLLRYRETSGADSVLAVCDGTSRWTYQEKSQKFTRTTADEAVCTAPVAHWSDLTRELVRANVTAHDQCDTVEAVYINAETRTFCIDPIRHIIVREQTGANSIAYSRVEYRPPQPAEAFQFQPPPGSSSGGVPQPFTGEGGSGNYADFGSAPIAISTTQPDYTPEARQAGLQGIVQIRLTVDEQGMPRDLHVVRALGMGLDQKALEAVSKWRFRPGTRAGQPAAAFTQVEVRFRLP